MTLVGSKKEVYEGKAVRTSGGLYRKDLIKNGRNKVVSLVKHLNGVANHIKFPERLGPYQYTKV
jgi:hypothetical protein